MAPPCTSLYTKAIGTHCCYGFLENENFRQNENLCIFCSKEDLSRRLVCEVTKDMLSPPPGILFLGLHANIVVGTGWGGVG